MSHQTEYLRCKFSGEEQVGDTRVAVGGFVVASSAKLKYLGAKVVARYGVRLQGCCAISSFHLNKKENSGSSKACLFK